MRYCRHCQKNVAISLDAFSNIEICSICGIALGEFHLPAGTILGGFQIETELSHDSMGAVYRARQLNLERNVALKILSTQLSRDLDFVDHFFDEARAAAGLNHPSIVQIFDAGSTPEGIYYLAMELIEGETLASRIKREGSLPPEIAIDIAGRIASALGYAWEKQELCHGDIKPGNIIMNSSGEAKLADLGLAKSQNGDIGGKSAEQLFYIAPELISGDLASPNMKSDIYSFAATLYHMLAGIPPFSETDPAEVCRMHLNEQPEPLNKKNSDIDLSLSDFISRMLSKNPADRPESWTDVVLNLEELQQRMETHFSMHSLPAFVRGDDKKLLKLILGLSIGVIILTFLALGLILTQKRTSGLPSPETKKKEILLKWEKLKASTKFQTPANAIIEVEHYIEINKPDIPADTQLYLEQLKKKKADDEVLAEQKKSFKADLEETVSTINTLDIEKTNLSKLRDLKYKMNSLAARAKQKSSLAVLLNSQTSNLFAAKIKAIDKVIEHVKEQELKKAAVEEAERLKDENEKEQKSKLAFDEKRKLVIQENIVPDDYFLTLYNFMKNPPKKRTLLQLAADIEEFSKRNNEKFPDSIKDQVEALRKILATPLDFIEILAKCDPLFKGVYINVKSLQEPGYKINGADSAGIKLMIESEQAKIGKKVKWDTLKSDEINEVIKKILLPPGNMDRIDLSLKKLTILNLIAAKREQEADTYLSRTTDFSDSDKRIWQDIINNFSSLDSETAAILLWHDISRNPALPEYLKNQLALHRPLLQDAETNPLQLQSVDKFIYFNSKFHESGTYQRYNFLVNDFLSNSELPTFQATLLIRKTEPELKSGNFYKSLDLLMTAMARYGNAINKNKTIKAFFEKQKNSTFQAMQENSAIKSEKDNKLPFYYWENETPGDALIYRNILAKNKIIQSSSLLAFLTASAEIDSGDWSNAQNFIKNYRNFAELANTKGTYSSWIPSLLFGAAYIASRYGDMRLLSDISEALENISRSSDDSNTKPLAIALAMETALLSRNVPSAISMAETYRFEAKPSKNDIRIVLLHLTALLQQETVDIPDFVKNMDRYQKLFAGETLLKSDFQWCRFVANMLRSTDMPSLQEVDALEKTDCFAKNICAVMLADAFAMKLHANPALAKSPSAVRIFRLLQSKVTNNMVAGDLLNRLNLISLSLAPDTELMLLSVKNILSDTRIPAITYYPQAIILKSGIEILKDPNLRDARKKNLKELLAASVMPSGFETYSPSLTSDADCSDYLKNMISSNAYQQAFTIGSFNILSNADISKVFQSNLKILNDSYPYLTWQERLFIKKLENLLK